MMFAYPMGLLMSRLFRERQPSRLGGWIFVVCAVALCALLAVPGLGVGSIRIWYEVFCVCVCFPVIVWFAARGDIAGEGPARRTVTCLGDISYPLYAIHYPMIYLYIGWINAGSHPFGPYVWCTPVAVSAICIALAVAFTYLYDKPVRRWLTGRFSR